jgi:hypothetical protein
MPPSKRLPVFLTAALVLGLVVAIFRQTKPETDLALPDGVVPNKALPMAVPPARDVRAAAAARPQTALRSPESLPEEANANARVDHESAKRPAAVEQRHGREKRVSRRGSETEKSPDER